MDISFTCGSCGKGIVTDEASGQIISCPKCGKALVVPVESEPPVEADTSSQASAPPTETKPCPFCGKTIKRWAYVCKYCGHDLTQPATQQVPVDELDVKQGTQQISLEDLAKADADITFDCHGCGQRLVIDISGANMVVDCPKCGKALVVPRMRSH